jgi:hypothetical protein
MRLSFSNCHLTYFLISSSLRPTVLTQYPFAQKCLPQYRFLSLRCLSKILIAHLPFKKSTISDTANFGGIDITKCMWSSWIFISRISSFFHSHSYFMISLTDFSTAPLRILNRYLGHHTIWYLHCQIACANLLKLLIEYLLLMFRVTILHLEEVFVLCK